MATIIIVRDKDTDRIVNVVRNPKSRQFLEDAGTWHEPTEFLSEEEYERLPRCRICRNVLGVCNGIH